MNDKKRNLIKNIIIISLIIIVIILLIIIFININKPNNKNLENNELIDTNTNLDDNIKDNNTSNNDNINNPNTSSNDNINSPNTSSNNNNNIEDNNNITEDDVINYVTLLEKEVESESNLEKFKTKFKDGFITIIDFIFYDTEIKGYKFSDLTNSAKIKIIDSALKIDNKIEEYIPNYKESISSTYNKAKDKLVMLYLDTTISVCSNNKNECDKAKEMFASLKDKISIGFGYIKEIAINGKNKIKDYYEIFRNS